MTIGKTRKLNTGEQEKLQNEEKIRNAARRKAQKVGKSISTDKTKLKTSKPTKPMRKVTKKRAAIR